jgi:hypothetical protein
MPSQNDALQKSVEESQEPPRFLVRQFSGSPAHQLEQTSYILYSNHSHPQPNDEGNERFSDVVAGLMDRPII